MSQLLNWNRKTDKAWGYTFTHLPGSAWIKPVRTDVFKVFARSLSFRAGLWRTKFVERFIVICPNCQGYSYFSQVYSQKAACAACGTHFIVSPPTSPVNRLSSGGSFMPAQADSGYQSEEETFLLQQLGRAEPGEHWETGAVIDNMYTVERFLSDTPRATVYCASHHCWEVPVVIKQFKPAALPEPRHREMLLDKLEKWRSMELFPYAVTCYYYRDRQPLPLIFSEYVSGGSLDNWCRSGQLYEGSQSEVQTRLIDFACQLLQQLKYIHKKGKLHLDVKPSNVLITPAQSVKLTGFGASATFIFFRCELEAVRTRIAAQAHAGGGQRPDPAVPAIRVPAHLAPDHLSTKKLVPATDIYNWALTVLEMFTGAPTWMTGGSPLEALEGCFNGDTSCAAEMPRNLKRILETCLLQEPESRPAEVKDLTAPMADLYRSISGQRYSFVKYKDRRYRADRLNNRGACKLDLDRVQEARHLFARALHADASHVEATYNLGMLRWRMGELDDEDFLSQLQHLPEARKNTPDGTCLLAMIQEERGEWLVARRLIERLPSTICNQLSISAKQLEERQNDAIGRFKRYTADGDAAVLATALNPSGHYLLAGTIDGTLRYWDTETGASRDLPNSAAEGIRSVVFSADAQAAFAGTVGGTLLIRDLGNGQNSCDVPAHEGDINQVVLTPGETSAFTCGEDGMVLMWNLHDNTVFRTFRRHSDRARSLAVSSDGKWLLSAGACDELWLHDSESGEVVIELPGHEGQINSVALSPDGRWAVSASDDRTLRMWSTRTGECVREFHGHERGVQSVCGNTTFLWLISGGWDKTVKLWEVATGRCLRTIRDHDSWVSSVTMDADATLMASGGGEGSVYQRYISPICQEHRWQKKPHIAICRPEAEESDSQETCALDMYEDLLRRARRAYRHRRYAKALSLARQARKLHTGQNEPEIMKLWRALTPHCIRTRLFNSWLRYRSDESIGVVGDVDVSADGQTVVSAGHDYTVRVWDTDSGTVLRTLTGHSDIVSCVALAENGKRAFSGSYDQNIRVWNVRAGTCEGLLQGHSGAVSSVALTPRARYLLSGSWDYTLRLWYLESGRCATTITTPSAKITSVDVCYYHGLYGVSGAYERVVRLWDLTERRCIRTFKGHNGYVSSVAISEDGNFIVSGSYDRSIKLWNAATGKCVQTFVGHTSFVTDVLLTPDKSWVISAAYDRTLRIWEVRTGRCVKVLEGHEGFVYCVAHSTNGRWMISSGTDMTLLFWELDWNLASVEEEVSRRQQRR